MAGDCVSAVPVLLGARGPAAADGRPTRHDDAGYSARVATSSITGLAPGDTLGRYRIVEAISPGGTGAVYRAVAGDDQREVAIKRMHERGGSGRFEVEARLLLGLEHPRVVKVRDHFEDENGTYCIVMDLVRGTDLSRMLWDRGAPGLPVSEVVEWTRQACEALQYTHEQQVLHGDVKPQNLICGPDGIVLVDFGAATALDAGGGAVARMGTPGFMAPEVFSGGTVSVRSDVYTMAATAWYLLSGAPPVFGEPTPLAQTVPGVSEELEHALRHGLELAPERRIASAQALADAVGAPLREREGVSLGVSIEGDGVDRSLIEAVVQTAAGVFEAAAASIALVDRDRDELVYESAWGAGAREIVGMRLGRGVGIAGAVVANAEPQAVPDCRADDRFAAQVARGTGYVPHTMLVVPLVRAGVAIGVLSLLDRRGGRSYGPDDIPRAELFATLALRMLAAPAAAAG